MVYSTFYAPLGKCDKYVKITVWKNAKTNISEKNKQLIKVQ